MKSDDDRSVSPRPISTAADLEELVQSCAQYNKKETENPSPSKPESFPLDVDRVEIRPRESKEFERGPKAATIADFSKATTPPTSPSFRFNVGRSFEGSYKVKGPKTNVKSENGRVEAVESEISFYSDGELIYKDTVESLIKWDDDKQITYKTKEGIKTVTLKPHKQPSLIEKGNFLKKFLRKRSDKHLLEKKGILRNEDIFGNKLGVLQEKYRAPIPPFVTRIMGHIEQEHNVKTEHIYRIPGNMATIQKIRLQIDKNNDNFKIIDAHARDVEVLTGTLKLFYRELVDPVIPYKEFDKLYKILVSEKASEEKHKQVRDVIESIGSPHRENLHELIAHLLRVETYAGFNKMSLKTLAIVWGPSLIWHQEGRTQLGVVEFSFAVNDVIELILNSYAAITTLIAIDNRQQVKGTTPGEDVQLRITRSVSDEGAHKSAGNIQKFSSFFNLKKTDSRERLSASNWSLSSSTASPDTKKPSSDNPFHGYQLEKLILDESHQIPKIIVDLVTQIETNPNAKDLYICTASKDYMAKFKRKMKKQSNDLSKIEILDLAIILIKVLRELNEPIIPETVFTDFCDNYDRMTAQQKRKFVENELRELPTVRRETLRFLMRHLFNIFEYQSTNKEKILNVWLPIVCNTTAIGELETSFNKLVFNVYMNEFHEEVQRKQEIRQQARSFEYNVNINKGDDGSLSVTNRKSTPECKVNASVVGEKFKSNLSEEQLNNIANTVGRYPRGKRKDHL